MTGRVTRDERRATTGRPAGGERRFGPRMARALRCVAACLVACAVASGSRAQPAQRLALVLPTSNRALFGDPAGYFTPTDKPEDGLREAPWQGGAYGFVRNARRTSSGLVYTRFHEGMDVSPIYRDDRGEPLDTVVSVDDGRVVFVNSDARASNYGRYVVVEHRWQGSLYYALYAHLDAPYVYPSQYLRRGAALGRLGYTGTGIDRQRAHVHVEFNVLLSEGFDEWFAMYRPRAANEHGRWNGQNMAAFDIVGLYRALASDPRLDLGDYLRDHQTAAFTVAVPGGAVLDLVQRYPWLMAEGRRGAPPPPSYEIAFTGAGFPLRVSARDVGTGTPFVMQVSPLVRYQSAPVNGYLTRRGDDFQLSQKGREYIALISRPAPSVGAYRSW